MLFIIEKQQKTILDFPLDSKILKLLNEANDSKSKTNYCIGNEIIYNTKVLKSNLRDYNDVIILGRGNITITGDQVTQVALKNCAPFTNCITKINRTTIDDAKDLDLVMPMYILIEYSSNYSETAGSLWFYSKDEAIGFNADIANTNNFKSLMYKAKLLENIRDY